MDQKTASVYRSIALCRRRLAGDPDLPPEALREMLARCLDACEVLVQSIDSLRRSLEVMTGLAEVRKKCPPGPGS